MLNLGTLKMTDEAEIQKSLDLGEYIKRGINDYQYVARQ